MGPTKKSRKSSQDDTDVSVSLEKAEEAIVPKQSIALVDTSIVQSIKNQAQPHEEATQQTEQAFQERQKTATRNRLLFYGAVGVSVVACYLIHRYFKVAPPTEFVGEIVNGSVDLVNQQQ